MNPSVGQGGGMAALPPRGIGELLRAAFQLYRHHWRTLMAIAAVVVVPLTLLQYGAGHWFRTNGQQLQDEAVASTSLWAAGPHPGLTGRIWSTAIRRINRQTGKEGTTCGSC